MKETLKKISEEYRKEFFDYNTFPIQFMGIEWGDGCGSYILVNVNTGERLGDKIFKEHGKFVDGVAPVRIGDNWGYVKEDGEILVEPRFSWAKESLNKVLRVGVLNCGMSALLSAETGEPLGGVESFDSVEFFGENNEFYLVRNDGLYGVLSSTGKWLEELDCNKIVPLSDEVAYMEFPDGRSVVKNICLDMTFVNPNMFHLTYFSKKFGVFACYFTEERKTKVYQITENIAKCLFEEDLHRHVHMECPGLITLSDNGIFSIKEGKWLYKDLTNFHYCQEEEDIPAYYELQRNEKVGFIDAEGKELIPIEVERFYHVYDNLLVQIRGKWGMYNLVEQKWLEFPGADVVVRDDSNNVFGFVVLFFGKKEKGFLHSKTLWRYFVKDKFISDYEYVKVNGFKFYEEVRVVKGKNTNYYYNNVWSAKVKRKDGKKGYITSYGEFYDEHQVNK